ncbi:putative leucine-rich repeat domain superfamily [Helianthus annuus]|nr:putative leucine-rich repeat domain superfamily [Helianthus annuus]
MHRCPNPFTTFKTPWSLSLSNPMGGINTFFLFIFLTLFLVGNGEQDAQIKALQTTVGSSLATADGFQSVLIRRAYKTIQAFKKKITYDPKNITKTWRGKNICRDYKGFLCDVRPDVNQTAIAGVKFNNYNFNGPNLTLTELITGLPDIVFFHANSNNFTGSIPTNLNKLKYFFELDLSNNNFSGRFPTEVLRANKLLFLDLRFNTFVGTVPSQVFGLKVDLLFINNNNFIQRLPANLGNTTALYLTLANNKFIGGLNGCLPYEIGFLKKATVFDVGFNRLHGPIPRSFQCLRKMELLNLAHNRFSGVVPEAVCSLPNLSNFTLSYNFFTQVGPQCRKLIKKGILNVDRNCISGLPYQRRRAVCSRFFATSQSCPNARSLTLVPCRQGLSGGELASSDIESTAPSQAPAQAPRRGSYGALSPH